MQSAKTGGVDEQIGQRQTTTQSYRKLAGCGSDESLGQVAH